MKDRRRKSGERAWVWLKNKPPHDEGWRGQGEGAVFGAEWQNRQNRVGLGLKNMPPDNGEWKGGGGREIALLPRLLARSRCTQEGAYIC
jgi:hypothetical protein